MDAELSELTKSTSPMTIGQMAELTDVLLAGIKKLSDRMAELEQTPFEYTGVHEVGKTYRRGQFATHNGSVWHAERTTAQRPGDGNAWVLACKAGKDARNER